MSVMPAYDKMDIKDHSKYGTIGSWHGMLKKDIVVSFSIAPGFVKTRGFFSW